MGLVVVSQSNKLQLQLFTLFIALAINLTTTGCIRNKTAKFLLSGRPGSCAPEEYDAFVHHEAFSSVLSPLVTSYKSGELKGLIADQWTSVDDHKEWHFRIRKHLSFSDGTEITPKMVYLSLKRIALVLAVKKSKDGLLEHLDEIEKLETLNSQIDGLSYSKDSVTLKFRKPMPKTHSKIGFGLYAIASPSDYDPVNGNWLDPKKCSSSGPYIIEHWKNNSIQLKLRKGYPSGLTASRPIQKFELNWHDDKEPYDIRYGFSYESIDTHSFIGGPKSNIAYFHIVSAYASDSPLARIQTRKSLRDTFYNSMPSRDRPFLSFFPPMMPQIRAGETSNKSIDKKPTTLKIGVGSKNKLILEMTSKLESFLSNIGVQVKRIPFSFELFKRAADSNYRDREFDIAVMYTGILAHDPDEDIRFMFQSKEGIRLPNPGNIAELLNSVPIERQKVNEALWEDASIWPYKHFSAGIWISSKIDVNQLNQVLPPTQLQWIGWR